MADQVEELKIKAGLAGNVVRSRETEKDEAENGEKESTAVEEYESESGKTEG